MILSPLAKPSLLIPSLANLNSLYDFRASGANARGAIQFVSSPVQKLEVSNNSTVQTGDIDFAIGCWYYLDSDTPQNLICKWGFDVDYILIYDSGSKKFIFYVSPDAATTTSVAATGATINTGTWYFVLAWHDSVNNTINIKINDGTTHNNAHTTGVHTGTDPFSLGAHNNGGTSNGRIDQAFLLKSPSGGIANIISTISSTLYNNGNGVLYSQLTSTQKTNWGLVSFWEMDESSGNRNDSHGTNHLSPVNSPTAVNGIIEGQADDLDPVATWDSGATALEQATITSRPTYRTTYVDFDGTDDQLTYGTTGGLVATNVTFTHLMKFRADALPSTGNEAVIYCEEDASATVQYRISVDDSGNIIVKFKPSGASLATLTGSSISAGTDYVIAIRREQTNIKLYIDGTEDQSATVDGGTTMTGATTRIGGYVHSTSSSYLDGRLYRILVANSALSTRKIKYYGQQL